MNIMLDTNVIISAIVFGGQAGLLLHKLLKSEHQIYISSYIDEEFCEKMKEKWPVKSDVSIKILHEMDIRFVKSTNQRLGELRDEKDVPVLSDARFYNIDILVTGDNDFLESDIVPPPIILSPSLMLEFLVRDED